MIKLLKSALIITVFAGFFHNLNAQDSLRLVPVKAWQLSRLIDETKAGRVCDQTLTKYINLVSIYEESQKIKDSLIHEVTLSRDTWKYTSLAKDTMLSNTKTIHDKEIKIIKRQKLFMTLTAIGEAVLIVLLL